MANPPPSHYPDIGDVGEDLVAQWLQSTGWLILHRRFLCRWGEIDIIAQYNKSPTQDSLLPLIPRGNPEFPTSHFPLSTQHSVLSTQNSTLAFVEVKTRSPGNWDTGGRSAITAKKQTKLWRTAGIFLAQYPEKADYPCRFDVAIVCCQKIPKNSHGVKSIPHALASSVVAGYEFQLQEYIPAAFDSVIDNA